MAQDFIWWKHGVFYQIYPRSFQDSNGDGVGDLQGIIDKLDYLVELGIDAIWISPIFPSPMADFGYDVSDYTDIHPLFGDLATFDRLLEAAHARNIHIVLDYVPNHTSDEHPWFIESRSSRDNPKRDWYVWSDTDQRYGDARIIFLDVEGSNWTFDEVSGQYYWHRFYSSQPDLNFDNPEVRAEMLKVADFWMEYGLDGFRADAVPYLIEREGTNCENLPETHQFLKELRAHMDRKWKDRILLCEANQWPEDVRPYFGDDDEFHMGFHFPVMPRLYMALKQQSRSSIVDIMQRTPEIPAGTQWCMFLRNHDELTLEMVTPQERDFMWDQYAPEPRMRLNLGIRRRLAPLLDNDQRRIRLLNGLLFTLPGSPIVYYGDEIGMGDNIWLEDRHGVRTPMQWDASFNSGFSPCQPTYSPIIDDAVYGYQKVNVEAQRTDANSIFNFMKHMIKVRKQHLAFGLGTFDFVLPDNEAVLSYWRSDERERFLVAANLTDAVQTAVYSLAEFAGTIPHDILTDQAFPPIGAGDYTISLAPYQFVWLKF